MPAIPQEEKPLIIPNFPQFGQMLFDRIYVTLRHLGIVNSDFVLFLFLLDRGSADQIAQKGYRYVGLRRLHQLFPPRDPAAWPNPDTGPWGLLEDQYPPLESLKETQRIMNGYATNTIDINAPQDLLLARKAYPLDKRAKWPNSTELEYQLLEQYFAEPQDLVFTSLPVFQFAELDGVAHFVLSDMEVDTTPGAAERRPEIYKQIIRVMTREYENLLWVWTLNQQQDNVLADFTRSRKVLVEQALRRIKNTDNQLLKELKYEYYYTQSSVYFDERIQQSQKILDEQLKQYRLRAISTILIDSFAHNISAHSLTVLKWWLQQRAVAMNGSADREALGQDLNHHIRQLVDAFDRQHDGFVFGNDLTAYLGDVLQLWQRQLKPPAGGYFPVRDQIKPMSGEVAKLLRYLVEKGAFWNGINREEQFGGEIRDLYTVLYTDFIENPLLFGTIAYSEGITRLHFKVRIYDNASQHRYTGVKEDLRRTYTIKTSERKEDDYCLLDGILATVDLSPQKALVVDHQFIQEGPLHQALRDELTKMRAYFPGGMVGRHAFYTIIENEIRNVKHYPPEVRDKLKQDGLGVVIGIYPTDLSKELRPGKLEDRLFKIGVWLDHPTQMIGADGTPLPIKRLQDLEDDIITDNQRPKMGGSIQDKICAAMLFNGSFASVANRESDRDKLYYPWIRAAHGRGVEAGGQKEYDFELKLSHRQDIDAYLRASTGNAKGYLKKYLYLWKGSVFQRLDSQDASLEHDMLARFSILLTNNETQLQMARVAGIVRVMRTETIDQGEDEAAVYGHWLSHWLGARQRLLVLKQGQTGVGYLLLDEGKVRYYSLTDYMQVSGDYSHLPAHELRFVHNPENGLIDDTNLRLRSHGILVSKFLQGVKSVEDLADARPPSRRLAAEMMEFLCTRVAILDPRIAERVAGVHRNLLAKQLHCQVVDAEPGGWAQLKTAGITSFQVVVLHLSFIESLHDPQGKPYREGRIVDFIRQEILEGAERAPDNFLLVVTTGRGRSQWIKKIKEAPDLARFTTFRPIESLLNAVETPIQLGDDVELKYNLIKVLLGS